MLSNQNERVLKALFNIELVNENRKDKIDQKETKKLIVKKLVEMICVLVGLEKNINSVMDFKFPMSY